MALHHNPVNPENVSSKTQEKLQGGSNMTGTNWDLFTHNQSRSYLNHLVVPVIQNIRSLLQLNFTYLLTFRLDFVSL
jgi:hypothetical protein